MERFKKSKKSKKVVRSRDMPTIMTSVRAKQESRDGKSNQRRAQSNGCHMRGQEISPNIVKLLFTAIDGLSQRPYETAADDELHIGTYSLKLLE